MDFKTFSKLIMIEQTLFALPFALIGVLFAGGGDFFTWSWVIVALAAARTAGMSFNRVIDANIDAKNPRTQDRLIPKGEVTPLAAWMAGAIASLFLVFASFMLNRLCFYLSFPAVFMLFTYSYFKRFSASSHFYLGFVEATAPIGGYLAAAGEFTRVPFILGFAIMTWIAGLDIVYALQDMEFDSKESLHSIPAKFGKKKSLVFSTICYMASINAMVWAGLLTGLGVFYWIAITLIGVIFVYQQKLARSKDIGPAIKMFFKVNRYISPILFFGALLDIVLG